MAKKLIAIEVDGTDEEAEELANVIWQVVADHNSTGAHWVYIQGIEAAGWDGFKGEVRVTERKTRRKRTR